MMTPNRAALGGADVAVEFTVPAAAPANIRTLVGFGCPVVVGTTGWYDGFDDVRRLVEERRGALLTAANFSLGVNASSRSLPRPPARCARRPVSTRTRSRRITPRRRTRRRERRRRSRAAAGRAWGHAIPITSVRTGSVPGMHEFIFDAPFEQIRLDAHRPRPPRVRRGRAPCRRLAHREAGRVHHARRARERQSGD